MIEQIKDGRDTHVLHVKNFLLLTNAAFVSVDVAGAAYISRWAVTVEHATDGVGVTVRTLSAGVTYTGVISMAE